jgi:hypothetical protein
MRTTLTLDDDVAAMLRRAASRRKATFKQVVNDALRSGLPASEPRPKKRHRYRLRPLSAGRPLLPSLDNIAEVLSIAEGDAHR